MSSTTIPVDRELLDYLSVCDSEFKPDLTAKITALIQRFAPDRRWRFDSLLAVLVQVWLCACVHMVVEWGVLVHEST